MLDPQNSADADPTWAVITCVTSGVTMIMTHIGALIAPPITTDEPETQRGQLGLPHEGHPYKWDDKSPTMGYNYGYCSYSPTHKYP